MTVSQIRHVLGERVAMKLLRLMKLSSRPGARLCPFCGKPMLTVNSQEPQMEVDACSACNAVWFDEPTYQSLGELAFDGTNFMPMQTTEIIAMERLEELKKRMEEERKQARRKKPLHRIPKPGKDDPSEHPVV
ncbi:MAG: zf-TFIIB domain-containing protein [Candidatus Dormibacteraceae bacterium]